MRVLILGGYGLIGGEILRALAAAGIEIVGLGRNAALGRRLFPGARWIGADLRRLSTPEAWESILTRVDAIVNAAGALQSGPSDDLAALHARAIAACAAAAEKKGIRIFVQISAVGARAGASTAFMRTKAAGDAALRAGALEWVILKPGLVISRNAQGGTTLIRMLAGAPLIAPVLLGDAKIQCVAASDVARAVLMAVDGRLPRRADYELVEEEAHRLEDVIGAFRYWLGFSAPVARLRLPRWTAMLVGAIADGAGLFGWRSPLRHTALSVLKEGVEGDPASWRRATGERLKSLDEALAAMPATAQERLFARIELLAPILIVALGLFWIVSGVIGVASEGAAAAHLSAITGDGVARALARAGGALDFLIGAMVLIRPLARAGAVASFLAAAFYLIAASVIEPSLWLDPLGPLVKIIPCLALSGAVAALLEAR